MDWMDRHSLILRLEREHVNEHNHIDPALSWPLKQSMTKWLTREWHIYFHQRNHHSHNGKQQLRLRCSFCWTDLPESARRAIVIIGRSASRGWSPAAATTTTTTPTTTTAISRARVSSARCHLNTGSSPIDATGFKTQCSYNKGSFQQLQNTLLMHNSSTVPTVL